MAKRQKTTTTSTEIEPAVPAENRTPVAVSEKPLTPTQQKNAERIIHGDFNDLHDRVRLDIETRRSRKIEEIEARYADNSKLEDARRRADEVYTELRNKVNAFLSEIKGMGVDSPYSDVLKVSSNVGSLILVGKNEEVARIHAAANRVLHTSQAVINRRHREALRAILVAGIAAPSSAEIINSQPQPDQIMGEVEAQLGVSNDDDLKTLGFTS